MGVGVVVVAVGDGAVLVPRVAVALGEVLGEASGATPADAVDRADGDAVAGAADGGEEVTDAVRGLCPGAAAADDSPAACFVRFGPPDVPSAGDEGEEEKGRPTISASTDAAPTAPAAATTYLPRRPPDPRAFRRRSARPGPGRAGAIVGSSRVSSYALSQPCAAAGSRCPSYAGAGSPSGR
ncbi:hypothetical protein [Streptomyces sp. NPDC001980]|uniref:hypothetical protein n=1 Tax=Streptomyces sp. NPDC001980 TaxID=3157126 RepID=UPI0033333A74